MWVKVKYNRRQNVNTDLVHFGNTAVVKLSQASTKTVTNSSCHARINCNNDTAVIQYGL
jgi:hypothetical protein